MEFDAASIIPDVVNLLLEKSIIDELSVMEPSANVSVPILELEATSMIPDVVSLLSLKLIMEELSLMIHYLMLMCRF